MALPKQEVDKAFYLFKEISKEGDEDGLKHSGSFIHEVEKGADLFETGIIYGEDRKSDDGWECVFINIVNINKCQLEMWEDRKGNIRNSSFMQKHPGNITRIGFF